jgi:hypothetical protein
MGFLQGGSVNWLLVSLVLFISRYPLIMLIGVPHEKSVNKKLEEALREGRVTHDLQAAFADKTARAVEIYGLAVIAVIVFLMVMKPF